MAGGWQEGGIRKAESRSHTVSSAGEFESTREPMKDLFSLLKKINVYRHSYTAILETPETYTSHRHAPSSPRVGRLPRGDFRQGSNGSDSDARKSLWQQTNEAVPDLR